jgi:hypothetical protein
VLYLEEQSIPDGESPHCYNAEWLHERIQVHYKSENLPLCVPSSWCIDRVPADRAVLAHIECVELIHVLLVELEVIQLGVRNNSLGRNRFRKWHKPVRLISYTYYARSRGMSVPLLERPS